MIKIIDRSVEYLCFYFTVKFKLHQEKIFTIYIDRVFQKIQIIDNQGKEIRGEFEFFQNSFEKPGQFFKDIIESYIQKPKTTQLEWSNIFQKYKNLFEEGQTITIKVNEVYTNIDRGTLVTKYNVEIPKEYKETQQEKTQSSSSQYPKNIKDALDFFGLTTPIEQKLLRKIWIEKAKIFHPDRQGEVQKMTLLNQYYHILKKYQ